MKPQSIFKMKSMSPTAYPPVNPTDALYLEDLARIYTCFNQENGTVDGAKVWGVGLLGVYDLSTRELMISDPSDHTRIMCRACFYTGKGIFYYYNAYLTKIDNLTHNEMSSNLMYSLPVLFLEDGRIIRNDHLLSLKVNDVSDGEVDSEADNNG